MDVSKCRGERKLLTAENAEAAEISKLFFSAVSAVI
jgi:hypothetical protein